MKLNQKLLLILPREKKLPSQLLQTNISSFEILVQLNCLVVIRSEMTQKKKGACQLLVYQQFVKDCKNELHAPLLNLVSASITLLAKKRDI